MGLVWLIPSTEAEAAAILREEVARLRAEISALARLDSSREARTSALTLALCDATAAMQRAVEEWPGHIGYAEKARLARAAKLARKRMMAVPGGAT